MLFWQKLANTPGPKRESALVLVKNMPVLEAQAAVEEIVRFYLEHRLMPEGAFGDAVHLALASLHKCDFLVTWNCKHLADANKLDHIKRINGLIGLTPRNWSHPWNFWEICMNKKYDDGLEWLRKLRLKIAAECGNDVHAINECYRAAAARVPHRSYRDNSSVKRGKRKNLVHG